MRQHMYVAGSRAERRGDSPLHPPHRASSICSGSSRVRHADIAGSGLPKRDDSNERFEARVWEEVARKPAFSVADLAIGGGDVIAAMVARGLAPSRIPRRRARRRSVAAGCSSRSPTHPERNEREVLLALLDDYLADCLTAAIG